MEHKKAQVQIILNELAKIENRPLDKNGNLDVEALNKLPEVVSAKQELKEIGADRKWLFRYFPVAGMILS